MDSHNVKFKISLSNGETLYEGKGILAEIHNEPSPLQKLFNYISSKKVYITSLTLQAKGREYSLPSAGNNPRFKAFADARRPLYYKMYRKLATDVLGGNEGVRDLYTVGEAVYRNYSLQLWVNEDYPHQAYTLILENEDEGRDNS